MSLSTQTAPGDEVRRLEGMIADKIDQARLVPWLRMLNMASAKPVSDPELASRSMSILLLVGDLPAFAFSLESARRVRATGFPSAAAVRTAVGPAVREHAAQLARLRTVAPERTGGSRGGWSWLSYYRRRIEGAVEGMPPPNDKHLLSLLHAHSPAGHAAALGVAAEVIEGEADRAWWVARIEARFQNDDPANADFCRNPTLRWREARRMLDTLTDDRAVIRQWAVDRLMGIIRQAEDEGADTTEQPIPGRPASAKAVVGSIFGDPLPTPFSNRAATSAARASALDPPADRMPATAMRDATLAQAYAAIDTPAAQYRAAQLIPKQENPDA